VVLKALLLAPCVVLKALLLAPWPSAVLCEINHKGVPFARIGQTDFGKSRRYSSKLLFSTVQAAFLQNYQSDCLAESQPERRCHIKHRGVPFGGIRQTDFEKSRRNQAPFPIFSK